ncbi:hypothetical protein BDV98DRAFT_573885 [Pterulicium gracile]|uniref:Uncharacterized protein n=1 Tax=Pterulicium gracile TaxID=1884261 RepID=A0A5C3Q9V3_9AGAR|nr:hypothetical protein BDV98DRAFT_573885 [Pterula gracilis]
MCKHQVVGDFYRGCGHFHNDYYTGDVADCGSEVCKSSAAHKHKTARECGCKAFKEDDTKLRNLFRVSHESCRLPDDRSQKALSNMIHARRR